MLLVWLSMIPCVPALIVIIEWVQSKLPARLRDPPPRIRPDEGRGPLSRGVAWATERAPLAFVGAAAVLTAVALWKTPAFLRDPWEYDFDRLGSRGSKSSGAGEWSNKADQVFGGRMNVAGALTLADTAEQVHSAQGADHPERRGGSAGAPHRRRRHGLGSVARDVRRAEREARRARSHPRSAHSGRRRLAPPRTSVHASKGSARRRDCASSVRRTCRPSCDDASRRTTAASGTVFYVKYRNDVMLSDGHNLLRIARATDNVRLADGVVVQTASRATIFAEMLRSMEKDGRRASLVSLAAVALVVLAATRNARGALAVLTALLLGVTWMVGGAAWFGEKLNYVNFVTLPITFGIGCEYPFNVYDRSRLLGGDVSRRRSGA